MNDVAVRQNESIGRNDEARAASADLARTTPAIHSLFDVDVNDGGYNAINRTNHRAGILIEQGSVVWSRN